MELEHLSAYRAVIKTHRRSESSDQPHIQARHGIRTHSFEEFTQIVLLSRPSEIRHVQLAIVGSSVRPILLAIGIRDENRESLPFELLPV